MAHVAEAVTVGDVELLPGVLATPEGCVHAPAAGVVAAGDLHLGREATLRSAGALVPDFQATPMLERVLGAVDRVGPDTVVLNGDVKHGWGARNAGERRAVRAFVEALQARAAVVVVRGNHDKGVESMVPDGVAVVDHYEAGHVTFAHGHGAERPPGDALVLGHEHPVLALRDVVGATVRLPCFLAHEALGVVVAPALSTWARGVDVLTLGEFMSPLLAGAPVREFRAVAVSEGELLDFRRVGDVRGALRAH